MLTIPHEDRELIRKFVLRHDYYKDKISASEAKRILEEGVVEIFHPTYLFNIKLSNIKLSLFEIKSLRQHASNGLLVTKNGYFITCFHCVNPLGDLRVLNHKGESFPIEGICLKDETNDIALVKAKIPGPKEIFLYKHAQYLNTYERTFLLSRKDGTFSVNSGFVKYGMSKNKDSGKVSLSCNQTTKPGDSGGTVTNMDGGIFSIHRGIAEITDTATKEFLGTGSVSIPFFYITKFLEQIYL